MKVELVTVEVLTVPEVAKILRVSNETIYRLIRADKLEAIRVGKQYRIRRPDLDRFMA